MKIIIMLVVLVLAGCIFTKIEPVELCVSSPQNSINQIQCNTDKNITKTAP